jgi:hypothetical protein
MKKNALEKQKDRNAYIELCKGLVLIIIIGAIFGGLYNSPWPIYFKIIISGFTLLLFFILNELMRIAITNIAAVDMSTLIFLQLTLIGKKRGIKENQASLEMEEEQKKAANTMAFKRLLGGDSELRGVIMYIVGIGIVALITVILIE